MCYNYQYHPPQACRNSQHIFRGRTLHNQSTFVIPPSPLNLAKIGPSKSEAHLSFAPESTAYISLWKLRHLHPRSPVFFLPFIFSRPLGRYPRQRPFYPHHHWLHAPSLGPERNGPRRDRLPDPLLLHPRPEWGHHHLPRGFPGMGSGRGFPCGQAPPEGGGLLSSLAAAKSWESIPSFPPTLVNPCVNVVSMARRGVSSSPVAFLSARGCILSGL